MTDSGNALPEEPRRKTVTTILWVCIAIAAVFAAWQVHIFIYAPGKVHRRRPAGFSPASAPQAGLSAGDPRQLIDSPEALAGMKKLIGEPGGIAPPPGAVRRPGFERLVDGQLWQHAAYECPGKRTAVEAHYRAALARAGFEARGRQATDSGRLLLGFVRGPIRAIVSLKTPPPGAKMIQVALIVISPANEAKPAAERTSEDG